jgi:hypothetical protein
MSSRWGAWVAPLLLLLYARYYQDGLAAWLPFMEPATFKSGFEAAMLGITLVAGGLLLTLGRQSWAPMRAPSAADPVPSAG